MAFSYQALITVNSDFPPFRRLSEPSLMSEATGSSDNGPSEGLYRKYNSLPQYGKLHGFLQRLSTRRNNRSRRGKNKVHIKQDSEEQKVLTESSSSNELEVQSSERKNGFSSYRYRKLKVKGYHRTMSDSSLLKSRN